MKALITLIFTLIFSVCAVFSQNAKIDSLKRVIATTKMDTVKGRSLCRLCRDVQQSGDAENALKFAQEGLIILKRKEDSKGEILCLSHLGHLYKDRSDYQRALEYYHQCLEISQQIGFEQGLASAYNNIGIVHSSQANYPHALNNFKKSLKLYQRIKNQVGIGASLLSIGNIYSDQSNDVLALDYYQKSLEIFEQIKDQQGTAICQKKHRNDLFQSRKI